MNTKQRASRLCVMTLAASAILAIASSADARYRTQSAVGGCIPTSDSTTYGHTGLWYYTGWYAGGYVKDHSLNGKTGTPTFYVCSTPDDSYFPAGEIQYVEVDGWGVNPTYSTLFVMPCASEWDGRGGMCGPAYSIGGSGYWSLPITDLTVWRNGDYNYLYMKLTGYAGDGGYDQVNGIWYAE